MPLILDLSTFISSAAIHVLFKQRHDQFAVVCPPGHVARVLDIVHAQETLALFDDLVGAEKALSNGGLSSHHLIPHEAAPS